MCTTVLTGDTEGGQADGDIERRRTGFTATQVRVLSQRHRTNVPLSLTGQDHSVPGRRLSASSDENMVETRKMLSKDW